MVFRFHTPLLARVFLFVSVLLLVGCVGVPRKDAVPLEIGSRAQLVGAPNVRYLMDSAEGVLLYQKQVQKLSDKNAAKSAIPSEGKNYLSISGGGQNGAFSAGLLVGWTESGTRPNFDIVAGISTGALLAPFAFLGPSYDQVISELYTSSTSSNIYSDKNPLSGFLEDSIFDDHPLALMLDKYITSEIVNAVSDEYRANGRLLLVGTTNLDSGQSVVWNMGEIASLDTPNSLALFKKVLLASASVPALFPPVMFDVEYNGVGYQEMHVDGGASNQVFMIPYQVANSPKSNGLNNNSGQMYVIRNDGLLPAWADTRRWTVSIALRSIEQIINRQGVGDLLKIYDLSNSNGMQFNLAYIDNQFNHTPNGFFDEAYMRALFNFGMSRAKSGYPWAKKFPP